MAPSGRDRDPAFKRRKIVAKPTSKHVDKPKDESTNTEAILPITPTDSKKETLTPIPVVNPTTPKSAPETTSNKDSLTTPMVESIKNVQSALVYEDDSDSKKIKSSVPPEAVAPIEKASIKKEETKISAAAIPPPEKPTDPPSKRPPDKGSKKRKILVVFMAIIFIVGIGTIGYYMVNKILEKENNQNGVEALSDSDKSKTEEEGEAHAGDVTMNDKEDSESEEDDIRETSLTEENSLDGEMNGNESESNSEDNSQNANTKENNEKQEKQALSKVIRKKGDFEIPCWIVAFSANSDKPLANMNYSALEALGFDAGIYWIPKYFSSGKSLYKVYVGPYKTPEQAQAILPQMKNLQPDAYVMKIDE